LREWPQSETVCAFQSLRMEVTIILFFEANTEGLTVEFATRSCLTDDWTKARDEQYLDVAPPSPDFSFRFCLLPLW
jgi:hypothetical protein